jgi:hypothetical protein
MDINSTWKSSFPVFSNNCMAVDVTLAAATPTLILPAIQAALALLTLPNFRGYQLWLIAGAGVTDVTWGSSANPVFPLPHLPAAGGIHPEPLKVILSEDRTGSFDGPTLVSAGGGVIHCLVWAP